MKIVQTFTEEQTLNLLSFLLPSANVEANTNSKNEWFAKFSQSLVKPEPNL